MTNILKIPTKFVKKRQYWLEIEVIDYFYGILRSKWIKITKYEPILRFDRFKTIYKFKDGIKTDCARWFVRTLRHGQKK